MPGIRTLSDMVTQVRRRADMEYSEFVSDEEVQQYIQDSYGELFDLIIESAGEQHFAEKLTFSTKPNQAEYELTDQLGEEVPVEPSAPLNVYKMLGVDVKMNGYWYPTGLFNIGERDESECWKGWEIGRPVEYRVFTRLNEQPCRVIEFMPVPLGIHEVRMFYIPLPPTLIGDGTLVNTQTFQSFSGWDEFIVCDAAAKCMEKEESDPSFLLGRKAAAADRIRWHAMTMDQNSGGRVRNIDAERWARRNWWRML